MKTRSLRFLVLYNYLKNSAVHNFNFANRVIQDIKFAVCKKIVIHEGKYLLKIYSTYSESGFLFNLVYPISNTFFGKFRLNIIVNSKANKFSVLFGG